MQTRSSTWKRWSLLIASLAAATFLLQGCGGSDGAAGPAGPAGAPGAAGKDVDPTVVAGLQADIKALTQAANPETCSLCHAGTDPVARSGPMHQEKYKEFYQDGVVKVVVGSISLTTDGVDTTTLKFKMTKNGANFDCRDADSIAAYFDPYDAATKSFTYPGPAFFSLKPTAASGITYDGAGGCTYVSKFTSATDKAIAAGLATANGVAMIYGVDEILETDPVKHLNSGKYPFAGVLKVGTVDYTSAANVSGCENCHTQPFLKHTYIYGTVTDNTGAKTEFYTCKGCHSDKRAGGHIGWQVEKDNPARAAAIAGGSAITAAENTKYAYQTHLMNDVHMSHAMEFAYPQSMKNCVTCHAGKMDKIFAADKFTAETCISCHSVDGIKAKMTAAKYNHSSLVDALATTDCTACHKASGGVGPSFSTIHDGGYDPKIYSTTGERYSDKIVATINDVKFANNILTIKFSATGSVGSVSATSIVPTVLIGLYGYNTKDFIVAAHGYDSTNTATRQRNLEYVVGTTTNPRFKTVTAANGQWEVTADLTLWADKLKDGSVKRAEIAILPTLKNPAIGVSTDAASQTVALNAPSKTFNFTTLVFEPTFFQDIVKVAKTGTTGNITGCNTCHDALATTFHAADRGGNIKVCRICHEVSNGGAHLELQSRSIDSYIHAIHSFQAFDIGTINFNDPTASYEYTNHIGTEFPRFGITNCESCHNTGKYDVPNQGKSMPGVLSGTATVANRKISALPPSVTGPAVRACGGCHRAQVINTDDESSLTVLLQHFRTFGYVVNTTTADAQTLWASIVAKIMAVFSN